jgi:hypothetical protein
MWQTRQWFKSQDLLISWSEGPTKPLKSIATLLATDQKVRSSNLFGRAILPKPIRFKLNSVSGLLCLVG